MFNIGGGELLLLVLLALVILGPNRLPGYAQKLAHGVRTLRDLAENARSAIKEEMGPAFEDVDWSQLDPRQYDPRRIVREALSDPAQPQASAAAGPAEPIRPGAADLVPGGIFDPSRTTPYDTEAT